MFWTLDESSVECHHSTPSLTIASSTVPACKPPIVYHGGESKSNKKQYDLQKTAVNEGDAKDGDGNRSDDIEEGETKR